MDISARFGDSLWYYSQIFSLPLQLILDSNRSIAPNQLQIGMRVSIPGYVLSSYHVQAGDSLWGIAQRFGLPLDRLLLVNQQLNPAQIQMGESILIPRRITNKLIQGARVYSLRVLSMDLAQLSEAYPFIRREVIGTSVIGHPIEEIRIGYGPKKVHYNGSFHANEWITTPVLMEFINDYVLALTNGTSIRGLSMLPYYESVELSVVPMVNPDGVDLVVDGLPIEEPYRANVLALNGGSTNFSGWKANISGVDL